MKPSPRKPILLFALLVLVTTVIIGTAAWQILMKFSPAPHAAAPAPAEAPAK